MAAEARPRDRETVKSARSRHEPASRARATLRELMRAEPGGPTPEVRLYHFPTSLCSQKVRLALAEKGVAWEGKTVNIGPEHEQLQPWYARLNKRLVVPTLEVDGAIITDSAHIVQFIDQHFPGKRLVPDDPVERDEVLRWVSLQDQFPMRELGYAQTKGVVRWVQGWMLRQKRKRLRRMIRKHPELTEVYQHKLADLDSLERAIKNKAAARQLIDEAEEMLDMIERRLADSRWLAGDHYTLADLVWTAVLARLEHIGFARSMAEHRRPRVAEWYARLRERPSWDAMIRRLTFSQMVRFYGPAVAKTFVLAWVLKWVVVLGIGWLVSVIAQCGG